MPAWESRSKGNGAFSHPDGLQIAWELNDVGWIIGLGVGQELPEPSCIPYFNVLWHLVQLGGKRIALRPSAVYNKMLANNPLSSGVKTDWGELLPLSVWYERGFEISSIWVHFWWLFHHSQECTSEIQAINLLPMNLDLSRFDDGSGIEDTCTLRCHNAKYHHRCRNMFSNYKLERATEI